MEFELVILGQMIAFLAISTGTIFAVTAPRKDELILEPSVRQQYVDRMGR